MSVVKKIPNPAQNLDPLMSALQGKSLTKSVQQSLNFKNDISRMAKGLKNPFDGTQKTTERQNAAKYQDPTTYSEGATSTKNATLRNSKSGLSI